MGASRLAQWLKVLCLILGPLGAVLVELVTPLGDGDSATSVAQAAAHPTAMRLVLVGDGLGLFLIPAVLIVASLTLERAPRVGAWAGTVAFAGYACLVSVISEDMLIDVAGSHADRASAVALVDAYTSNGLFEVLLGVYLVGSLVGLVLIGAALWRSRVVPPLIAAFVIAEPGFEVLDHVVGLGSLAGALGYALVTVAFAVCATRIVHGDRLAAEMVGRP
jgi:hypothetical protein